MVLVEITTLAQMQEPDDRSLMWSVWTAEPDKATELAQYALGQIELCAEVPETTCKSFERLCLLFAYGILSYDLYTVAGDLARLVIEQALRERFLPFYDGTVNFDAHGMPQSLSAASYEELYWAIRKPDGRLRGWKLQLRSGEEPFVFSGGLKSLLRWARAEHLLGGQADRLRDQHRTWFRNFVAHPSYHLQGPDHAERAITDLADVINRLWGAPACTAVSREPVIITWTDRAVTWGPAAHIPEGSEPVSVVVLATPGDPELGDYDALYETTSRPSAWLWGPGTPGDASQWLKDHPQPGDQAETIDRLFLLRYNDSLLWLPQKPATAASLAGTTTSGTWYLLRADSPFPAFNHQRCVLSGYTDPEHGTRHDPAGNCRACPTQTIAIGGLLEILDRAAQVGANVTPQPVPDVHVSTSHMPRANKIHEGGWSLPS